MKFGSLEYPDITQTTVLRATAVYNLVAGYHLPDRRSIYSTIISWELHHCVRIGLGFSEIRQEGVLAQDADSLYKAARII